METFMNIINFIVNNGPTLLEGVVGLLSAIIVIALVIPGEQPEKALQGAVNFLKKFSRK